MKIFLFTCLSFFLIACQNDSYSLQISKLIEDGRNDLESVQDQLKGSQISSKFYLMYIHESIARLIYLEKGKGDAGFVDVKCELDENSLETFSTFKPPLQIKVTGIVKDEGIEVKPTLLLRGLANGSLNYILEKEKLDQINVSGVITFNMKNCDAFR